MFPHLDELLNQLDTNVWKPVLPSPPRPRVPEHDRRKETKSPGPDDYIQVTPVLVIALTSHLNKVMRISEEGS